MVEFKVHKVSKSYVYAKVCYACLSFVTGNRCKCMGEYNRNKWCKCMGECVSPAGDSKQQK